MRAVRGVRGRELDLSRAALVREGRVHEPSEEGRQTQRERDPILHASDRRWRSLLAQAQHHASRSHAFQSSTHQRGQCGMYFINHNSLFFFLSFNPVYKLE
jgi:hypothetical protein